MVAANQGQQATGTRNTTYDLVSILYHCLEGGTTYQQYIDDARSEGDNELADFFQQIQEDARRQSDRAKELLKNRM